jgi:hypothetical protein
VASARGVVYNPRGQQELTYAWGLGEASKNQAKPQIKKPLCIEDSMVIIQQMRKLSKARSSSPSRLIDKTQRIAGHFEQITFYHVLFHLISKVDAMANRSTLLNQGQMVQNGGGIIFQYLP